MLRSGDTQISAANLAEVLDVLIRRDGFSATEVAQLVDPLVQTALVVVGVTSGIAWSAARVRARHYHRRDCALSLADCIAIATSLEAGKIATADALLAQVARDEGVEVIVLPNSEGVVPDLS